MTQKDSYKHLNDDKDLKIVLDMDALADQLCTVNYGVHRFLSALVDARRKKYGENNCSPETRNLTEGIEKLLNKGYF